MLLPSNYSYIEWVGNYGAVFESQGGIISKLDHSTDKKNGPNGPMDHIFFPRQNVMINGKERVRGGCFPCYPFLGERKSPPFSIENNRHGWLRNVELDLSNCEEGEGEYEIEVPFSERKKHLDSCVSLKYILSASGLFCKMDIKADHSASFPVNPGWHPYFYSNDDYLIQFGNRECLQIKSVDNSFSYRQFPYSEQICIHTDKGVIKMRLSGDYDNDSAIIVWSDSPYYLCVEPVYKPLGKYITMSGEKESTLELNMAITFRPNS